MQQTKIFTKMPTEELENQLIENLVNRCKKKSDSDQVGERAIYNFKDKLVFNEKDLTEILNIKIKEVNQEEGTDN